MTTANDGDSPPLEAAVALGDGQWDLAFHATAADQRASRELPDCQFINVVGMMLVSLGLPLLPSLLILACFQMLTAALVIALLFAAFTVVAGLTATHHLLVDGVSRLKVRRTHLDVETDIGSSRLHWSLLEQVETLGSWVHCHGADITLLIPRRILTDAQLEALLSDLREHIHGAASGPPRLTEADRPGAPAASPEFLFLDEHGPFDFSEPFRITADEQAELLSNLNQLAPLTSGEDDPNPMTVSPRQGCLTLSLLLMLGAAALIAATPASNSQRIVQWFAACAAIWLPQLIWRWRENRRLARELQAIDKDPRPLCRHGINGSGICSATDRSRQFRPWEHVVFITSTQQLLVYRAEDGNLFATPKRALASPEQTLQQAEHYWRQARQAAIEGDEADSSDYQDPDAPVGPAAESGNPYQPPA